MTLLSFESVPPAERPIPNVNWFFVRSGLRLISFESNVLLSAPVTPVPPSRIPQPPPVLPSSKVGFVITLFLMMWLSLSASPSAVIRLTGGAGSREGKAAVVTPGGERGTGRTGAPGRRGGRGRAPRLGTPVGMGGAARPPRGVT